MVSSWHRNLELLKHLFDFVLSHKRRRWRGAQYEILENGDADVDERLHKRGFGAYRGNPQIQNGGQSRLGKLLTGVSFDGTHNLPQPGPIPPAAMSITSPALISSQTLLSLFLCSSSGESAGPDRLWSPWSRLLGSLSRLQVGSAVSSAADAPAHTADARGKMTRSQQTARRIAQRHMACSN